MEPSGHPAPVRPVRRRLRGLAVRAAIALAGLAALCVAGVNCAGSRAVRRYEAATPRDPQTGVIVGAEPVRIDRGRKAACLLLHGWICTPADYGALPQALDAAGWDVYCPLQLGHGTTPRDLRGVTADRLLAHARQHYAAVRRRYQRVVLVGFSMGGAMAAMLAAEHPPDRLVLVAPFCGVRHRWYYLLPAHWWDALVTPLVRYVPRPAGSISCHRPEGRKAILSYGAFPTDASHALFRLRSRLLRDTPLARLTMPTLLVYSTGDDACSPKAIDAFGQRLPAQPKRVTVFTDSGHHLFHDHDREQAIAAVVEFVGKP